MESRRMWQDGPLRLWSPVRTTCTKIPHGKGGFVGSYVCESCEASRLPGVTKDKTSGLYVCERCHSKGNAARRHGASLGRGIGHSSTTEPQRPMSVDIGQESALYGGQANG